MPEEPQTLPEDAGAPVLPETLPPEEVTMLTPQERITQIQKQIEEIAAAANRDIAFLQGQVTILTELAGE